MFGGRARSSELSLSAWMVTGEVLSDESSEIRNPAVAIEIEACVSDTAL